MVGLALSHHERFAAVDRKFCNRDAIVPARFTIFFKNNTTILYYWGCKKTNPYFFTLFAVFTKKTSGKPTKMPTAGNFSGIFFRLSRSAEFCRRFLRQRSRTCGHIPFVSRCIGTFLRQDSTDLGNFAFFFKITLKYGPRHPLILLFFLRTLAGLCKFRITQINLQETDSCYFSRYGI